MLSIQMKSKRLAKIWTCVLWLLAVIAYLFCILIGKLLVVKVSQDILSLLFLYVVVFFSAVNVTPLT